MIHMDTGEVVHDLSTIAPQDIKSGKYLWWPDGKASVFFILPDRPYIGESDLIIYSQEPDIKMYSPFCSGFGSHNKTHNSEQE